MTCRAKIEQITEQGFGLFLLFLVRISRRIYTRGVGIQGKCPLKKKKKKKNTFPSKNAKVCVLTCKNRVSNKPFPCGVSLGVRKII